MLCPHRGLHGLIEAQFLEKKIVKLRKYGNERCDFTKNKDGFRNDNLLILWILFPFGAHGKTKGL